MVLAQEIEDLFGLGGLGESGVATQIAKYDDDVTRGNASLLARGEPDGKMAQSAPRRRAA